MLSVSLFFSLTLMQPAEGQEGTGASQQQGTELGSAGGWRLSAAQTPHGGDWEPLGFGCCPHLAGFPMAACC